MPIRLATFNLENLDDVLTSGERTLTLEERLPALRPQLLRLRADILCLQEVNGQERAGKPRRLHALDELIQGTPYEGFHRAHTRTTRGEAYDERNLVVLSRFPITHREQLRNDLLPAPLYRKVTAVPEETEAGQVRANRPVLYVRIGLAGGAMLHLINVHLKSKNPTSVAGQMEDRYTWRTASGWAEGYFLSAMKRVSQAVEVRMHADRIFKADEDALIAVAGDFNAGASEVPVEAIAGRVENTQNAALVRRQLVRCALSVARSRRHTLIYEGQRELLDHVLISRSLLGAFQGAEIHNEVLHDEGVAFAFEKRYPESDHAPFVVTLGRRALNEASE